MKMFDFIFGKGPITNLEHDIITDDNQSGLFSENEDEVCENCGELLEDCECENKQQSRKDAGIIDYDEIDELEDMEENDFDDDEW